MKTARLTPEELDELIQLHEQTIDTLSAGKGALFDVAGKRIERKPLLAKHAERLAYFVHLRDHTPEPAHEGLFVHSKLSKYHLLAEEFKPSIEKDVTLEWMVFNEIKSVTGELLEIKKDRFCVLPVGAEEEVEVPFSCVLGLRGKRAREGQAI